MNRHLVNQVKEYVENRKEEIIRKYGEFVNLKDFWRDIEDVNIVGEWLKREFEAEGVECRLIDAGPEAGRVLIGILGQDRPGKAILFSGHMDTALASDLYPDNPFRVEDGKAYGPGVLDMKGGILITLYVIKALNAVGYKERPLKILFVPDEEGLHTYTKVADFIRENSSGCLFALNMETGLLNNSLAVGRKGRLGVDVFIKGKSAHAGADFLAGISSIEEMAHKVLDFQKLTNLEKGTTVNTGVIKGGTIPNAVPAECMCSLDIRFKYMSELERIRKAIAEICEKNYIEGTACAFKELNLFTPFETQADIMKLFDFIKDIAERYGLPSTEPAQVGGCSDATYIQLAGTPVLCSCGARGEWNHTLREYTVIDSLYERICWFSAAVIDSSEISF
ncbi:M20/M25/M40 family metallo-hydrolase [Colibacter massiliensis]|uniref:M20/M25/M40 family metallo-hydrolase n=1 Tax=Colibacter massiliensis TaxID=1852379 RepID=UPI003F90614C